MTGLVRSGRPTWIEVSIEALRANLRALMKQAQSAVLLPVVKANAYGHGLGPVAKVLMREGVTAAAVALAHEGASLRATGFKGRILLIEPTLPEDVPTVLRHRLVPQLSSLAEAVHLDGEARHWGLAPFSVQIEVDTGMGRVGFKPDDLLEDYRKILSLPGLRIEAVYTHLATADWKDGDYAREQIRKFHALRDTLAVKVYAGAPPPNWHLANSAALLGSITGSKGDFMRPGLALYGVAPNARLAKKIPLVPVMSFKAKVLQVKNIARGESVGYNRTYVAKKPIRIAVLAAGYADGILRSLSNKGACLIGEKRAPLVGNVCMDMCMADVTRLKGVKPGDTAVFWGRDGRAVLPVEEQAASAGTIPYELLCAVGSRVERIYA